MIHEIFKSKKDLLMLIGGPGTGKSYIIKQAVKELKNIKVTAPTGQAADNLSGSTINSTLGIYQFSELMTKHDNGQLTQLLLSLIIEGYRFLLIDEAFMIPAQVIDILISSLKECNELREDKSKLKLVLVGDPAQIPPVKGRPTYETKYFNEFEVHKLTVNQRQKEDSNWADALKLAREGKIIEFANACHDLGLFQPKVDLTFEGLTIIPTNKDCEAFNKANTAIHRENPKRLNGIRGHLYLAKGSPIFIKSNLKEEKVFNGQRATVLNIEEDKTLVRLDDGREVRLPNDPLPAIMGPASTAHAAQGRTLNSVQVVLQESFKRFPGGLYVAMTRTPRARETRIIGNRKAMIDCFSIDHKAFQLGLF
jgi:ATP-dependent exoDNAse (exonuclease V) alpha subunit